jgi:gliding motility-associated-like protein
VSIGDASSKEGTNLSFPVTLNHMSSKEITVTIGFVNVTTADNDYTGTPVTVIFPAGSITSNFVVPTTSDALQEVDETFTAKITDSTGPVGNTSDTGTGTIVDDDNYPIAADDDAITTNEDTPVKGNVSINDTPNSPNDRWTIVQPSVHGVVAMNPDGNFTYTPEADFNGKDSFTYKVCDAEGDCDEASVAITVLPVDDSPVANDDIVSFHIDDVLNDWVTDNDVESGDGGNIWSIVTQPANGNIVFNADGSYVYTPGLNFVGSDTFTYRLCDADGDCDQASVTISIEDVVLPNQVLTPNGDTHNDTFIINGIEFYPENDLTIYNRWGNKVYQKSGYQNEWDGISNENKVGSISLPVGTYFYVLKYGNQRHKTGYVYLDR